MNLPTKIYSEVHKNNRSCNHFSDWVCRPGGSQ